MGAICAGGGGVMVLVVRVMDGVLLVVGMGLVEGEGAWWYGGGGGGNL